MYKNKDNRKKYTINTTINLTTEQTEQNKPPLITHQVMRWVYTINAKTPHGVFLLRR